MLIPWLAAIVWTLFFEMRKSDDDDDDDDEEEEEEKKKHLEEAGYRPFQGWKMYILFGSQEKRYKDWTSAPTKKMKKKKGLLPPNSRFTKNEWGSPIIAGVSNNS